VARPLLHLLNAWQWTGELHEAVGRADGGQPSVALCGATGGVAVTGTVTRSTCTACTRLWLRLVSADDLRQMVR